MGGHQRPRHSAGRRSRSDSGAQRGPGREHDTADFDVVLQPGPRSSLEGVQIFRGEQQRGRWPGTVAVLRSCCIVTRLTSSTGLHDLGRGQPRRGDTVGITGLHAHVFRHTARRQRPHRDRWYKSAWPFPRAIQYRKRPCSGPARVKGEAS